MSVAAPGWSVGEELEGRRLPPITRLQLIKYAGASGDYNPIHLLDEDAKRAGLPGVIAHGMLTAAMLASPFSPYLEHGYLKEMRVRFSKPVYVGDELRIAGRASGAEVLQEGKLYTFEVRAEREEETVASGTVSFLVYRGEND